MANQAGEQEMETMTTGEELRLIHYLRDIGWTDTAIIKLLIYILSR